MENWLRSRQQRWWGWGALCSWVSTNIGSSLPRQQGLFLDPWLHTDWHPTASDGLNAQWRLLVGQPGHQAHHPATLSSLKGMSLLVRVWQNVLHWRREWQTTRVFLSWEPHEKYEKAERLTLKDEPPRSTGVQYTTGEEQTNSYRKNEGAE